MKLSVCVTWLAQQAGHQLDDPLGEDALQLLTSGRLYGDACRRLFPLDEAVHSIPDLLRFLSRKGLCPSVSRDSMLSESQLQERSPVDEAAHSALIEAVIKLLGQNTFSVENVVHAVKKHTRFNASAELPQGHKQAALFWLNKMAALAAHSLAAQLPAEDAFRPVANLHSDLADGQALCLLLHLYRPHWMPATAFHWGHALSHEHVDDNRRALDAASRRLDAGEWTLVLRNSDTLRALIAARMARLFQQLEHDSTHNGSRDDEPSPSGQALDVQHSRDTLLQNVQLDEDDDAAPRESTGFTVELSSPRRAPPRKSTSFAELSRLSSVLRNDPPMSTSACEAGRGVQVTWAEIRHGRKKEARDEDVLTQWMPKLSQLKQELEAKRRKLKQEQRDLQRRQPTRRNTAPESEHELGHRLERTFSAMHNKWLNRTPQTTETDVVDSSLDHLNRSLSELQRDIHRLSVEQDKMVSLASVAPRPRWVDAAGDGPIHSTPARDAPRKDAAKPNNRPSPRSSPSHALKVDCSPLILDATDASPRSSSGEDGPSGKAARLEIFQLDGHDTHDEDGKDQRKWRILQRQLERRRLADEDREKKQLALADLKEKQRLKHEEHESRRVEKKKKAEEIFQKYLDAKSHKDDEQGELRVRPKAPRTRKVETGPLSRAHSMGCLKAASFSTVSMAQSTVDLSAQGWANGALGSKTPSQAGDDLDGVKFSRPPLFRQPEAKSNKQNIINAINKLVLAGPVHAETRKTAIEAMTKSDAKHFIILFRDYRLQYRAVYAFLPDSHEAVRVIGQGPKSIHQDMIEKYYKYNSGAKHFDPIAGKLHLDVSCDAFTIHSHFWAKAGPSKPTARKS